ncbi:MAG: type 1 glutamine amidotransferase [Pararhodobacter sp.]
MKIGILETGPAPETLRDFGDYPSMFRSFLDGHGFTFETYHVKDMDFPTSATACDGWIITGSKYGVYEDHAFIPPLEQLIRDALDAGRPVVGICFGHQIMAQALGGKVEKFAGGWSVGPTDYDFDGQVLRLNAWHQDQVVAPPPGARTIASSPFCRHAGLAYGDKGLSVQPHPEFGNAFIDELIETRGRGVVPDTLLDAAKERLSLSTDGTVLAARIADFFKQHAGRTAA